MALGDVDFDRLDRSSGDQARQRAEDGAERAQRAGLKPRARTGAREHSIAATILARADDVKGWDPSSTPTYNRDLGGFLARIAAEARLAGETEASFAATVASRVLRRHISEGESLSVLRVLPQSLRELLDTPE
jgi:uncharacterized protein (DUF2267 family)